MSDESINDMQDPLWMHKTFKAIQHVIIPNKFAAGRRERTWIGPHLSLQRESSVIRVAEVKVTRKIHILKDLQVPVYKKVGHIFKGGRHTVL